MIELLHGVKDVNKETVSDNYIKWQAKSNEPLSIHMAYRIQTNRRFGCNDHKIYDLQSIPLTTMKGERASYLNTWLCTVR